MKADTSVQENANSKHTDKLTPKLETQELAGSRLLRSSSQFANSLNKQIKKLGFKQKTALLLILIAIIGSTGFFAYKAFFSGEGKEKEEQAVPVLTVTVEQAQTKPLVKEIKISGTVSAWDHLSIGAETNGLRIEEVFVEEGDQVQDGQVLAQLNNSVLKAELAQCQAQLKANQALLTKALQPNRSEDIAGLEAAYAQAQANVAQHKADLAKARASLDQAKHDSQRYSLLGQEGAVSQQDVETKRTLEKTWQAELSSFQQRLRAAQYLENQAEQKLKMAKSGGRKEDIEIAQATVAENLARLNRLNALIEQTIIRAPSSGQITKRNAHIGDISSSGKSLFELSRDNRLELRADLPEVDLVKIKEGQKVEIISATSNGQKIIGLVRLISPTVDTRSRLAVVRVDLPSDCGLKPGMFVKGLVQLEAEEALTIPTKAVATKDNLNYVFVLLENNKVQRVSFQAGYRNNELVEVLSGLSPQSKVITKGVGFLKDGDTVRVVQP